MRIYAWCSIGVLGSPWRRDDARGQNDRLESSQWRSCSDVQIAYERRNLRTCWMKRLVCSYENTDVCRNLNCWQRSHYGKDLLFPWKAQETQAHGAIALKGAALVTVGCDEQQRKHWNYLFGVRRADINVIKEWHASIVGCRTCPY